MKRLFITFFLFILTLSLFATTYWVSPTGTDLATGRSRSAAWQTIDKVNSYAISPGFQPGDIIQFKRGGTYTGTLTVANSGTNGHPITFAAWGEGAKPVISGFTTITGWTQENDSVWSKVIAAEDTTNMVRINNVQYGMGRTPNSGTYNTYESASTNVSITDTGLGTTAAWDGAEVVILKNAYKTDRCVVTDITSDVITYRSLGSTLNANSTGNYFFQNSLLTLDSFGEWYHDTSSGKFYMYFGDSIPTDYVVEVATTSNLINSSSKSYVVFKNLKIEGSINNMMNLLAGTDIIIDNCELNNAGLDAVYSSADNTTVSNCIINDVNRNSMNSYGDNLVFEHNTVTNNNYIIGQGQIGNVDNAIYAFNNNPVIRYNSISNTGTSAIYPQYGVDTFYIGHNYINNVCKWEDDGGAIYCTGSSGDAAYERGVIEFNVIINTNDGNGVYIDATTHGVIAKNNLISGAASGIMVNRSHNDSIINNTVYDSDYGINIQNTVNEDNQYQLIVTGNKVISKSGQITLNYWDAYTGWETNLATSMFDNNYYARPVNDSRHIRTYDPTNSTTLRSVAEWLTYSSQDANTQKSEFPVYSDDNLIFIYATNSAKDTTLTTTLVDVAGTAYSGTITLQPYTGLVLMDSTTYSQLIRSDIIAYWNLDQNSSTLEDAVGSNDLTNSGAVVNQTGKLGQAVLFDTTSDDLYVNYNSSLLPTGNAYTISLWTNVSAIAARYFFNWYDAAHNFSVRLSSVGQASASIFNTTPTEYNPLSASGLISTGNWYHIVVVNYGVGIAPRIYVNGRHVTTSYTTTFTGTLRLPTGTALTVGNSSTAGSNAPAGLIDEVGFWNRWLRDDEILHLYNSGIGKTYPFQ